MRGKDKVLVYLKSVRTLLIISTYLGTIVFGDFLNRQVAFHFFFQILFQELSSSNSSAK